MKDVGVTLLEPVMRVEIVVPEEYLSVIMKDLPKRRAEVKCIDTYRQNKVMYFFPFKAIVKLRLGRLM